VLVCFAASECWVESFSKDGGSEDPVDPPDGEGDNRWLTKRSADPVVGLRLKTRQAMTAGEFALMSAGPWRQTTVMLTGQIGHENNVPTRLHDQLRWCCLAVPQLPLAPLQAILTLDRANLAPLQAIWRLLQTVWGNRLILAPLQAKVTPLQAN